MIARFTYQIAAEYDHAFRKGQTVTLYGRVQGTSKEDALENAKWISPRGRNVRIVEEAIVKRVKKHEKA